MAQKKKIVTISTILIGVLSACATFVPNQEQANFLVRDNWLINHCVSNGWAQDVQILASYQMAIEEKMINATPESVAVANVELKQLLRSGRPGREQCRNLELYAHKVAGWRAESQAQKEAFQQSMSNLSQRINKGPRYANCSTYAGVTTCVAY